MSIRHGHEYCIIIIGISIRAKRSSPPTTTAMRLLSYHINNTTITACLTTKPVRNISKPVSTSVALSRGGVHAYRRTDGSGRLARRARAQRTPTNPSAVGDHDLTVPRLVSRARRPVRHRSQHQSVSGNRPKTRAFFHDRFPLTAVARVSQQPNTPTHGAAHRLNPKTTRRDTRTPPIRRPTRR